MKDCTRRDVLASFGSGFLAGTAGCSTVDRALSNDSFDYESPEVVLFSYGLSSQEHRFEELSSGIEEEFYEATEGAIELNVAGTTHFDPESHYFAEIKQRYSYMEDFEHEKDVPRIWYYHNQDVLESEISRKVDRVSSKETDVAVAVTDLQFEGNGLYLGTDWDRGNKHGLAMVPSILLGGFVNEDYNRIMMSDNEIVEETIHELGHYYRTGHREDGRDCLMSHGRDTSEIMDPHEFCEKSLDIVNSRTESTDK